MSWIYVTVGIVCLVVLHLLRVALSVVFPRYGARPIGRPDANAFGGVELVDSMSEAYARLGFRGPAWIGSSAESVEASGVAAHAAFRNPDRRVVAWLGPTVNLASPHQLLTYYTTLLNDGRYAVTQVADTYFELVDDPKTPAQTIPSSSPETELASHLEFVQALGEAATHSTAREDVLRFAGEHMTGIRTRLLERGLIREVDGVARPSLGFALRLFSKGGMRAASDGKDADVPVERLGFFARNVERSKARAPSQSMQWTLLMISAGLSILIGWPLFGLEFTLIVVAVITLHEGGHWLAMRLSGYRNAHITLLPLLGGVTIGHENEPNSARRAWIALAGPVPGIVLGWGLLFAWNAFPEGAIAESHTVLIAAVVLLFVNYLNVLPIPPLDGSHVVQSILPPNWVLVQILLLGFGIAIGVYVAWLLDFWPLVLIALLQLLGVRSLLLQRRLITELRQIEIPSTRDEPVLRTWLLEWLQHRLGAPASAAKRIGLVNALLGDLQLQPMGGTQRVAVGGVYGALLVVPVAALISIASFPDWVGGGHGDGAFEAAYADVEAAYDEISSKSGALTTERLIDQLFRDAAHVPPATSEQLQAFRSRFGQSLPAGLESFYRTRNGGLDVLAIAPIDDVRPVDSSLFSEGALRYYVYEGSLAFWDEAQQRERLITVSEASRWWLLGKTDNWYAHAFIDPNAIREESTIFVVGEADMSMYGTVEEWLRAHWTAEQHARVFQEYESRIAAILEEAVSGLSVTELMDSFPEPPLLTRFITLDAGRRRPASSDELRDLERMLDRPLPSDHREALEYANGFEPTSLLGTSEVRPGSAASTAQRELILELAADAGATAISATDLDACWIVGGRIGAVDDQPERLFATVFWCPELPPDQRYVSMETDALFSATYSDVLREQAARAMY